MIAKLACAALHGVDAFRVDLEVDFTRQGLPMFTMVGLAEAAVREARERVLTALRNCGFKLPPGRVTVNLAPADRRKAGTGYDLPMALGLLAACGLLDPSLTDNCFFWGELSLNGELSPVPGVLPVSILAREQGAKAIILPLGNAAEAAVVEGLPVYGVKNLPEAVALLTGQLSREAAKAPAPQFFEDALFHLDFAEVKGQEHAKRAIEIAAAGAHNLLFIGPPGSGKTMLAQRIPSILPPLAFEEALEVTKIYSVAERLQAGESFISARPFRSPHHTISSTGLIGGGAWPKPGEVSLAHRGVLFLDELPEFGKHTLEVLRQPLEDGEVTISRAAAALSYPADFMLVAAMNPCPCGYLGDDRRGCKCGGQEVQRYRARLSGPLLDRIDLHIEVPAVPYSDLRAENSGPGSKEIRNRVTLARAMQSRRYAGENARCNADLSGRLLEKHCRLDEAGHNFLENAVRVLALSARSYTRILRIARSIADLEAVESGQNEAGPITVPHLAEALNCRCLDRKNF